MSMQDIVMHILCRVPPKEREQAIRDAITDRTEQAVTHAADRARNAAIRLHERAAVRSGAWNGTERRKEGRRTICGDCPHSTP